jgi:D-arabinose 1-dehydrogenase-like Zn-dependent alcohol dehydrogenase
MRAAVVQAPGDLAIAELPDPAPRDHEVVVAVEFCGIWRPGILSRSTT